MNSRIIDVFNLASLDATEGKCSLLIYGMTLICNSTTNKHSRHYDFSCTILPSQWSLSFLLLADCSSAEVTMSRVLSSAPWMLFEWSAVTVSAMAAASSTLTNIPIRKLRICCFLFPILGNSLDMLDILLASINRPSIAQELLCVTGDRWPACVWVQTIQPSVPDVTRFLIHYFLLISRLNALGANENLNNNNNNNNKYQESTSFWTINFKCCWQCFVLRHDGISYFVSLEMKTFKHENYK